EIRPPVLPATRAVGLGIRFTRNFVLLNCCVLSPIFADTLTVASPVEETRALYLPPDPEIETPEPDTIRFSRAIPGAETEIGLSTPMYSTFILSGDTTAEGRAT